MRWVGQVARRGEWEVYTGFCWQILKERDRFGYLGVDGRIILRRIFRKWVMGIWTVSNWLRTVTGDGHL